MADFFHKQHILIGIILALIVFTIILFLPMYLQLIWIITPSLSISIVISFILRKHWRRYQQAECTHEKMMRNLAFDIISLLLTMGTAMYVGGLAGGYFGLRAGFWFGLVVGFLGGFVAAWMVRAVLGRLIQVSKRYQ